MKIKTIKATLRAKLDELLETIEDEEVRKLVAQNTIATGGCIASMLLKEPVNDFDLYFRNKETALAVANYYVKVFTDEQEAKAKKAEKKKKGENDDGKDAKDREVDELLKKHGMRADKSGQATKLGATKFHDPSSGAKPTTPLDGFKEAARKEVDVPITVEDYDGRIKIVVKSAGVASDSTGSYHYFEGDPDGNEASKYLKSVFEGNEFQKRKPGSYAPILLTDNAITLSDDVQLVLRFYGDPEEIHKFYDFVHCTNYWTSWDDEVVTNKGALESLLARELRYVGSQYPICSIIRIRKFIKRGWTINAGQIFKMCVQLSAMVTPQPEGKKWYEPNADNLLLDNMELLQDQLAGVDQAYFIEIIEHLKKPPEEGKDGKTLDQTYLFQLIDEVF